jgi:hypothetical protein
MNIPSPVSVGDKPAASLLVPFGWFDRKALTDCHDAGHTPILLHELGNEKVRQDRGPRELRELTEAALEREGWAHAWGLGAVCRNLEEAAHFATTGFTWFTLELGPWLDPRAATMSLDELDAAIVRLEDQGCYAIGWHDRYLEQSGASVVQFSDEPLARVAVRFGAALAEAEQWVQAIRASASGRGDLPDLEISIRSAHLPTSPEDLAFLAAELCHRGLIHGGAVRIAPCIGPRGEENVAHGSTAPGQWEPFTRVLPETAILSVPGACGAALEKRLHCDATDASRLAYLRHLAATAPGAFRTWLTAAHASFPTATGRWRVSTTEDDVRFLPEVPDDALTSTFLENTIGRELLLTTWEDVAATQ